MFLALITAFVSLISVFIAWFGTRKLIQVNEYMNGIIRNSEDLALVRKVINLNLKLSLILITLMIGYFCLLAIFVFSGSVHLLIATLHLFLSNILPTIVNIWTRKKEREFKTMKVDSDDPKISATFHLWIKQWSEFRANLQDE